jgi:hypothetical protein
VNGNLLTSFSSVSDDNDLKSFNINQRCFSRAKFILEVNPGIESPLCDVFISVCEIGRFKDTEIHPLKSGFPMDF